MATKLKVNEDGRKLGLRPADAKKLETIFDNLARAKRGIEGLKKCNAEGCEDREEACAACIIQAEALRETFFEPTE